MRAQPTHAGERSVDSFSTIYAVVIALALTQAIQTFFSKDFGQGPDLSWSNFLIGTPAFLAFLVTIVPFWHGMNRHLDRCYREESSSVKQRPLLFDFFVFLIEAILLFTAGWSLRSGLTSFYCLGALLGVDVAWGAVSHYIHFKGRKSHVWRWSVVNFVSVAVASLVLLLPYRERAWALMVIAIGRTIADYHFCSSFYFPNLAADAKDKAGCASTNIEPSVPLHLPSI